MEFRKENVAQNSHAIGKSSYSNHNIHNIYYFFKKDLVFEECMYICVYAVCVCVSVCACRGF